MFFVEKRNIVFAELDYFEIYREYLSKGRGFVEEEYFLENGDFERIEEIVEEGVCGVSSFSGNLESVAKQCSLPVKIVRDILKKKNKFISNSSEEAYKFLTKKER